MIERRLLTVQGVVQGIGFRPFAYRIAVEENLLGFVQNDGMGVTIEIEGAPVAIDRFVSRLGAELPTGGRLDRVCSQPIAPLFSEASFRIASSRQAAHTLPGLSPDRFVCEDCIREMNDPSDRRYLYPFINCTHCGPRYTIVEKLPYDRSNTSMRAFELCDACLLEYQNPLNRRFHAEPIACPVCGPKVWLEGAQNDTEDAIVKAGALLSSGRIVAVKGIGGFHLAVNAADREAVDRLRHLKRRQRKPFALMVKNLALASGIAHLDDASVRLLTSPAAPIVLASAREEIPMTAWIAPGLRDLGILLPYSPLHHLLLSKGPPILVMTSGNAPSEPISICNDDALACLSADATLLHDRDIVTAADDSVIRAAPHGPVMIRRARGYVPDPIDAAHLPDCSTLGLGALLKVTVTALHQHRLVVGRHLGDLDNERAEDAFLEEVDRMLTFLRMSPERIAVDLYPNLASSTFARARFPGLPVFRVQHHHAHLAAVMVEHGLYPGETAVGIILDGFGLGTDGALWGGEVLIGGYESVERTAHLRYIVQPGGDRAAVEPNRMAQSLLLDAGLCCENFQGFDPRIVEIARIPEVSPQTSSTGRLFDGAAALIGIAPARQDYEGEAAALLEAAADPNVKDAYPLGFENSVLDTRDLTYAIVEDSSSTSVRAARFINGLADGLVRAAVAANIDRAVLGGGCMVNRLLAQRLIQGLSHAGLTVLLPKQLPPGDGAISAGQAAVAACGAP